MSDTDNVGDAAQNKIRTKIVASEDLFAGATAIAIVHDGSTYTLRITKQNKLILTK